MTLVSRFRWALTVAALALTCGAAAAQQRALEPRSYPVLGPAGTPLPSMFDRTVTWYNPNLSYSLNGNHPRSYASYTTGDALPTYMTSINYPTIYGSYGYVFAPGRYNYGVGESAYNVAPNLYAEYGYPTTPWEANVWATMTGQRVIPDTAALPANTTAAVDVRVPADAEVRFQGQLMTSGGTLRRFVSPALEPARNYTYDVTATWHENGRDVSRSRHISVRAGEQVTVDFVQLAEQDRDTTILRTRP